MGAPPQVLGINPGLLGPPPQPPPPPPPPPSQLSMESNPIQLEYLPRHNAHPNGGMYLMADKNIKKIKVIYN